MSVPISMYFPKNSYLVDLFNNLILLFHQSGLMSYWTSVNEDPKYLNFKPQSERRKITIEHLSGPFQIWMGACSFSVVVFAIEFVFHRKKLALIRRKMSTHIELHRFDYI